MRGFAIKKNKSLEEKTLKNGIIRFLFSKRDSSTSGTGPLLRKGILFTTSRQANTAARTAPQMFAHQFAEKPLV